MAERSRHGLRVVSDGDEPDPPPITVFPEDPGRALLELRQESVVLRVTGRLNADTSGRLRMFLAMFTVAGGPRKIVLDLSDVDAIDAAGMGPIYEADAAMSLREGSLQVISASGVVAHLFGDVGYGVAPVVGAPLKAAAPAPPAASADRPEVAGDDD